MTKIYCDICGKEIHYDIDGVNLNFNSYYIPDFDKEKQYELCVNCAKRVQEIIKNMVGSSCVSEDNNEVQNNS